MDLNDGDSVDISISPQLTERTIIKEENGALHAAMRPWPPCCRSPSPAKRALYQRRTGEQWDGVNLSPLTTGSMV